MHHTQGILEFLKTSTPEAIEAFCNARFQQNLMFFQTDYPNLFQSLQAPAKEYQLLSASCRHACQRVADCIQPILHQRPLSANRHIVHNTRHEHRPFDSRQS